jgi:integrase
LTSSFGVLTIPSWPWNRNAESIRRSGPRLAPRAVQAVGAEGLHFHDLRHTDNTFAAESGAKLRDLMARMGHDSERAAPIYQHESRGADQAIADAIDRQLRSDQGDGEDGDGSSSVLVPAG